VHYVKLYDSLNGSCCDIAVDPVLNRIYVSSGVRLKGNNTSVVDASSFTIVAKVKGFGGAGNVDPKTHNVWLPGLYKENVAVYSGIAGSIVTKVQLGDCPIESWVDGRRRYAWIAAQCGSYQDPAWVVNADTYVIVAGPIHTPGVMEINTVNPVTGKFYAYKGEGGNFEINPVTFKASATSFGIVLGVNTRADLLYAQVNTNDLNIIDGRSEKIEKTVTLSYTPSFIGVNPSLNHIYLSAGQNVIEVREGETGRLLKTITLPSGADVVSLAADDKRARIYAIVTVDSNVYLYERMDQIKG
jgi:DNA-binding beta-propeller fold protein YncE